VPKDADEVYSEPRRSGNFEARALEIEGLLLVGARRFGDARGHFAETYSRRDFATLGIAEGFLQDNQSLSAQAGTVRGLHFQTPPRAQAKLVRVLRGRSGCWRRWGQPGKRAPRRDPGGDGGGRGDGDRACGKPLTASACRPPAVRA